MIDIAWCERAECEAHVKALTTATTRVVRTLEEPKFDSASPAESRRKSGHILRSRIRTVLRVVVAIADRTERLRRAYAPSVARARRGGARSRQSPRRCAAHRRVDLFDSMAGRGQPNFGKLSFRGHLIVGIRILGVKFHRPMTRGEFVSEVVALVETSFAAAPDTEEIDLWTSVRSAWRKERSSAAIWPSPRRERYFSSDHAPRRKRRVAAGPVGGRERRRLLGRSSGRVRPSESRRRCMRKRRFPTACGS